MKKAKTNIVIPSWNAREFTEATLQRLNETVDHPYYLTVIDNNSKDGTQEFLRGFSPSIHCLGYSAIFNTFNCGPGGAYQQGYEISLSLGTPYTVLSNNDAYYSSSWLDQLEETLEQNPEIGVLGTLQPVSTARHPLFEEKNAKEVLNHVSNNSTVEEELEEYFPGYSFDAGAHLMVEANGSGLIDIQSPPDAIPTSCAIVNNSAIRRIGHVADPRYEIYGSEDVDLSWELGKLGYRCAVLNDVYVHHFRHRSSNKGGLDLQQCLRINNRKFIMKWYEQIEELLSDPLERACFANTALRDKFTKLRRMNENVTFFKDGELIPKENL